MRILFYSVVVALGGFLFGFDTAVISGAEQAIEKVWQLNVYQHGLTVSIALIGTVFGAMFGGFPSDKIGRKYTLFWIAVLYWISAVGSALATDWYLFLFFRFIGGVGVGVSSVAAPLYISEIAPANSRGRLVALFQFNIVLGILVAYLSNYLIAGTSPMDWRWMLGVEALPALVFLIAVLFIPKSPRWLIVQKNLINEARDILETIRKPEEVEPEVQAILASRSSRGDRKVGLFNREFKFQMFLVIAFAMFNQLSGINAIIYYAPRIFEMAGLKQNSALLSTIGIGVVNFLATLLALYFIDRFGRKFLMFIGSFGLIATLAMVSRAFYIDSFANLPVFFFVYIAFFAFSQGAVIWVFISEIFPNTVRANGQALGSFTHWLMAAVIAFIFPYVSQTLGAGNTFLLFSVMMVGQLFFVWKWMPETRGVALEDMSKGLIGSSK